MIEPAPKSQFSDNPRLPEPIIEKVLVKDEKGDTTIVEEFKGWKHK
jgi:hypothetical protein